MYNYNYGDIAQTTQTSGGMAILGILGVFLVILVIGLIAVVIISYWKLFKKAGKPGWAAIVPGYNAWVLNEIAGAHWVWFIILMVASAGTTSNGGYGSSCSIMVVIVDLIVSINIAKKFGKGVGFGVLCALLPFVGYPILAFGSDEYNPEIEVSPHGIFDRDFQEKHKKTVKKVPNECPKCKGKVTAKMNNCPNCGAKLK